eukprot:1303288-Pleurochrysis_carterae.AAC.2
MKNDESAVPRRLSCPRTRWTLSDVQPHTIAVVFRNLSVVLHPLEMQIMGYPAVRVRIFYDMPSHLGQDEALLSALLCCRCSESTAYDGSVLSDSAHAVVRQEMCSDERDVIGLLSDQPVESGPGIN